MAAIGKLTTNLVGVNARESVIKTFENLYFILDKYNADLAPKDVVEALNKGVTPTKYGKHVKNPVANRGASKKNIDQYHEVVMNLATTVETLAEVDGDGNDLRGGA